MIPRQFIDDLNRDTDLVALIGRYVKLDKKSNNYVGLCPFHQEKTPSFSVNPSKGFYYCFGCGASGNSLKFLMSKVYGGDFISAVKELASMLSRPIPEGDRKFESSPSRKLLDEAAAKFAKSLLKNDKAKQYLKGRKISKQTAEHYLLGYAPASGGLEDLKGTQREMLAVGLLGGGEDGKKPWPYFRNRIMFPIRNSSGKTLGFGGRTMTDQEPKYLNSPGNQWFDKSNIVYGLSEASLSIQQSGMLLAVEGYMDVVMLAEHGIGFSVATMGTAATAAQMRQMLARTDQLFCCFDGDEAGRRAAHKALANMMPALADGKQVYFVLLPQGEDPDSFVQSKGKEGLLNFIVDEEHSSPLSKMLVTVPPQEGKLPKDALLRRACSLVEQLDRQRASYLYEMLYADLAKWSGLTVDQLKAASSKAKSATPASPTYAEKVSSKQYSMQDHHIYRMLACLYMQPDLAKQYADSKLWCKSQRDLRLFDKARQFILEAEHTGEEVSLLAFLRHYKLLELEKQLVRTTKLWQASGDSSAKHMAIAVRKCQAELAKQQAREKTKSKLAKVIKAKQ